MKIIDKIVEILDKNSESVYKKGSCGELGDSFMAIDSNNFSDISTEIVNLMQIIFDPENQPNQFGIKNPFESNKNDFEKSVEPAIRYLLKNHNPHTKIFIDYDNAELLIGDKNHNLTNEVPD